MHVCITDNFVLTNTMKMDNSSIKDNIRKVRKARKLTQEELADRLDISLTAYRDLEKGSTNIVNANVIRLAELLGTSTEELFLGYRPVQAPGKLLEDVRSEYGGKIESMERRIADLEKLVMSLEDTIATKNEIIALLKKSVPSEN
jgi:transcriptional regulator with XRE-family HTH domain